MTRKSDAERLPQINRFLLRGFRRYGRSLIQRHFHTVAGVADSLPAVAALGQQPLIVYANHPGWWDPLTAHLICAECFAERDFFAPIDADALQRYRVLGRIGFYPLKLGTIQGAAEFLKTSRAILRHPHTSLWLTPEGGFHDVRDHSANLMPGLAHLCQGLDSAAVAIPLAIEYPFWEERLPELLFCFGQPIHVTPGGGRDKAWWNTELCQGLRHAQQRLAAISISRDARALQVLMRGGTGSARAYDLARRITAWATGQRFQPNHSDKL